MWPVVFSSASLQLHSYGLFLAAAALAGVALALGRAERDGLDVAAMRALCLGALLAALAGARIAFVAVNARAFLAEPARAFALWEGGLVFFGGVAAATAFAAWDARRRRLPFARVADALAPGLALGHAIGRLGCFAAGCCWGGPSALPWALRFPPESLAFEELVAHGRLSPAAATTPPLHPVQLYEALGELLLLALLLALAPRRRYPGQLAVVYLAGYALLRFTVENWRGDTARGIYGALSLSQWLALACVAAAALLRSRFSRPRAHSATVAKS